MKIGKSESIETITPAHWQKMAGECSVGWPMLRERIADLCDKVIEKLRNEDVLAAAGDSAMTHRVAGMIQERATLQLRGLTKARQ